MVKYILNSIQSIAIAFALIGTPAHAGQKHPNLAQYLTDMGTTFYAVPGVDFYEIGESAPQKARRLWPFDIEEMKEKYAESMREIMGSVFTPVAGETPDALKVSMAVSILNDQNAVSALIRVRIYKETQYYVTPRGEKPVAVCALERKFWDRSYLYIDEDYLSDEASANYVLRETIDKYFNQYLYEFVQHALYSYKMLDWLSHEQAQEPTLQPQNLEKYQSGI
jgi:hypothetical protein